MKLNTAQMLTFAICANGNSLRDYKAPHAYRGTPPRRTNGASKVGRNMRLTGMTPKLFTGHRP